MSKKYYYTDPLKAAWMLQEYKVKFQEGFYINGGLDDRDGSWLDANDFNQRLYIHPDCYEMFKPQVGDLVEAIALIGNKNKFGVVNEVNDTWIASDKFIYETKTVKIIQRNGKAFFIPEISK
jgi:hypothetical protein